MKKLGSVILVVSLAVFSLIPPKLSETSLAAGLKGVASKLISPELDVLAKEEIVMNEGRVTFVLSPWDPLFCSTVSKVWTNMGKVTLVLASVIVSETPSSKNVVKFD